MTQSELKLILNYNPITGIFTWLKSKSKKFKPNTIAGGTNIHGYTVITINLKKHYAHRLAWLYVHGYSAKLLDHIDGEKTNNKISNLRQATDTQNKYNRKILSNNTSGYVGVSKNNNKWKAQVSCNNKIKYLGNFNTPKEASIAYNNYVKVQHGEFYLNQNKVTTANTP